jgi:sialic acid synthase SpsE
LFFGNYYHFILDCSIGGPDASFSMDEIEFTEMVKSIRQVEKAIGENSYNLTEKQKRWQKFFKITLCKSGYKRRRFNYRI